MRNAQRDTENLSGRPGGRPAGIINDLFRFAGLTTTQGYDRVINRRASGRRWLGYTARRYKDVF